MSKEAFKAGRGLHLDYASARVKLRWQPESSSLACLLSGLLLLPHALNR